MYFSPPSGAITKRLLPFPSFLAISIAAYIAAPEEIPTNTPSISANAFAVLNASSSFTFTYTYTFSFS